MGAEGPTRLRKMVVNRVDLVKRGANQNAHIALFKREEEARMPDDDKTKAEEAKAQAEAEAAEAKAAEEKAAAEKAAAEQTESAEQMEAKIAELEAQLNDAKKELVEVGKKEEVLKSLPEPIAKEFKELQERAAEAEKLAKAERDQRLDREFTEQVAVYKHLSVEPEKFGPVLRKIEEQLPEEAKEVRRILDAAQEAVSKSEIFKTYGSDGDFGTSDSEAKLEALAKSYAKEHKVSESEAMEKVLDSEEGATLYAKSLDERMKVVR